MSGLGPYINAGILGFVALTAIGAGVMALFRCRPRYASTYTWAGMSVALLHLPLFLWMQNIKGFAPYYLLGLAGFAFSIVFFRGQWKIFKAVLWSSRWVYLHSIVLLVFVAWLLDVRFDRFTYLGWDAWWFWQPRAHFIYTSGILSEDFWNVAHASYPPLLNAITALYYYIQEKSGELPTLTAYWVIAFLTMQTFAERVDALVERVGAGALILTVFLLAPKFGDGGLYFRELVSGHGDLAWQFVFVAAVASGLLRGFHRPLSWDESLLVLIASLMKEEGSLLALVYVLVRLASIVIFDRQSLRGSLTKVAVVVSPILIWKLLVGAQEIESRFAEYNLFMPIANYVQNVERTLGYVGTIQLLPVVFPWISLLVLFPAFSRKCERHTNPTLVVLLLFVMLSISFTASVYLFYSDDRLNWLLNTTFGRLYGLPILFSLVLYGYYLNHAFRHTGIHHVRDPDRGP